MSSAAERDTVGMTENEEIPLSENASAVLVAVSEIEVAGQGGYADDIARHANLPVDAVRRALDELRDQDLVQEVRGDRPDLGPRFVIKPRD
jgi:DNA-binding IclR family transcriptional regulator